MDASSNSTYFMRPNRSLLQWRHITILKDWVRVPVKPFVTQPGTIEWMRNGQPMPLPIALVQKGISLNVQQVRRLLGILNITIPTTDKASLHKLLVESVLETKDDQGKAMDAYTMASKEEPIDSDLEEVVSCLGEEDANALDLKDLKRAEEEEVFEQKSSICSIQPAGARQKQSKRQSKRQRKRQRKRQSKRRKQRKSRRQRQRERKGQKRFPQEGTKATY